MKKRLEEICEGFTRNIAQKDLSENNGNYPIYGASGFVKKIDYYVSDVPYIGIVKDGAGVGRTNKYPAKTSLLGTMQYIVPNKEIDLDYLMFGIRSLNLGESYSGAAIPHIYFKEYKKRSLDFPNLYEQKQRSFQLNAIQESIDLKEKELSELNSVIQSEFVEMFGENPVESGKWEVERLHALSRSGGTYGAQSASSEYEKDRPRYIRITDINEDGSLNDDVVCSTNNDDDTTYKLVKGDFLFARMGATVGKTYAYSSGNMIFAGYLIRFQLNIEKIHPSFLFYFTKTEWYQKWVKNNQSGAAQPGINSNKYGNLSVPVPPINLQNKFVTFVQQIDKSKFVVKQQIADLQELLDSKMQEYFS